MNSPSIPGSQAIPRLMTQRAIGWSRTKIKNTKKGSVETKESFEVQAWELGVFAAGAALLMYLTGYGLPTSGTTISGSPGVGGPGTSGGLFNFGGYSFGGLSTL